jgi:UPF0042 nucleotide-binding protein
MEAETQTDTRGREAEGPPDRGRTVVVTGMSGAGKSSALKVLEDLGYEAVDNPPLSLLGQIARAGAIAIGIDIRTRDFDVPSFLAKVDELKGREILEVRLLFLDCDDEVILRRYTETRRRHPVAGDAPVLDGIRNERKRLTALRARANVVIDTSHLSLTELRRILKGWFDLEMAGLSVSVVSFSFARGLPREADLVFDIRFLRNPHYEEELRPLSGRDPEVAAFITADPGFAEFFGRLTALLRPLLPRYLSEGKSYLTIGVGCTGGRHRSVFVAEQLAAWIGEQGEKVELFHRDAELL